MDNGKVQLFDGDLDDYSAWLAEERSKEKRSTNKPVTVAVAAQASPAGKAAATEDASKKSAPQGYFLRGALAIRQPLVKEAEKLEKQLAAWQTELAALETRLADPALYAAADKTLLQTLTQRQNQLTGEIATNEERWLGLQEQIEQAS